MTGSRAFSYASPEAGLRLGALRYRRKSDGRRRRCTLGSYPTLSLEEARNGAP